jgi:excisionase family DNA binding protein
VACWVPRPCTCGSHYLVEDRHGAGNECADCGSWDPPRPPMLRLPPPRPRSHPSSADPHRASFLSLVSTIADAEASLDEAKPETFAAIAAVSAGLFIRMAAYLAEHADAAPDATPTGTRTLASPRGGEDVLVTARDAARLLGMSTRWLYRNARAGKLPFVHKLGTSIRFSTSGITRWLTTRRPT